MRTSQLQPPAYIRAHGYSLSNVRLVRLDLLEVPHTVLIGQTALPNAVDQRQRMEEERITGMSVAKTPVSPSPPTVSHGQAITAHSLGVAVPRLVHIKAKVRRFLHKAQAEQADDLERVVPVHRDLHVPERVQLSEILRLLERLRVERRISRLGERVSTQRADAVQRALSQNRDVATRRP